MKKFEQSLKKVKSEIEKGKFENLDRILESVSSIEELDKIREQKILLKILNPISQGRATSLFKLSARNIIEDEGLLKQNEMYADFTSLCAKKFRQLSYAVQRNKKSIEKLCQHDLIKIIEEVLEDELESVAKHYRVVTEEKLDKKNNISEPEAADTLATLIRQSAETSSNLSRDLARILNTLVQFSGRDCRPAKSKQIVTVKRQIKALVLVAHEWNLYEWLIDKITYGEWVIKEFECSRIASIKFDIRDKKLSAAKLINLRRKTIKLSSKALLSISSPEESKEVKKYFRKIIFYFFDRIVSSLLLEKGQSNYLPSKLSPEFKRYRELLLAYLDILTFDDELLFASAAKQSREVQALILSHYLSMLSLCSGTAAIRFVEEFSDSKTRHSEISIEFLIDLINEQIDSREAVESILKSYFIKLPTRSYTDLLQKSFIEISANSLINLGSFNIINWTMPVHSNVMQGGALGCSYGELLEVEVEALMIQYGWTVKRGVKVRSQGSTLTDADLIAVKGDLLLAMQIKGIAFAGDNLYGHWKTRKILEKGSQQAKIVESKLHSDMNWRNSIFPKDVINKVRKIQPIVLTNSFLFSGWISEGVPVVSIGYFNSLLKGAIVKYLKPGNSIVKNVSFSKTGELTSEEIVHLIQDETVEWKLSLESEGTCHTCVEINRVKLFIPEFVRRPR